MLAVDEGVRGVLTGTEFLRGIRFGAVALAAGVVLGLLWRLKSRSPAPVAGLLMAAAAWLALDELFGMPREMGLVLGALAVAGAVDDLLDVPMVVRFLLPVPGALLFATQVETSAPGWYAAAAAVAIVVGGALAAEFDLRYPRQGLGPPFVALAAAGVFATVPDTEHARALVAAFGIVAVLGWPLRLCRLGSAGALATLGLVAWVAGMDGFAREGSLVGALACVGLLVAEPAAMLLARTPTRRGLGFLGGEWWTAIPAIGLQVGAVYVASRVAGFRDLPSEAAAIAGAGLAASMVAMVVLSRIGPARSGTDP